MNVPITITQLIQHIDLQSDYNLLFCYTLSQIIQFISIQFCYDGVSSTPLLKWPNR